MLAGAETVSLRPPWIASLSMVPVDRFDFGVPHFGTVTLSRCAMQNSRGT